MLEPESVTDEVTDVDSPSMDKIANCVQTAVVTVFEETPRLQLLDTVASAPSDVVVSTALYMDGPSVIVNCETG